MRPKKKPGAGGAHGLSSDDTLGGDLPNIKTSQTDRQGANSTGMMGPKASANLQRITVKQAAKAMNISERSIYMVRKIMALRPDLATQMKAGTLSINAAYRIATNFPKVTTWDRLAKAWNAASKDEQARFVLVLVNTVAEIAAALGGKAGA